MVMHWSQKLFAFLDDRDMVAIATTNHRYYNSGLLELAIDRRFAACVQQAIDRRVEGGAAAPGVLLSAAASSSGAEDESWEIDDSYW